MLTPSDRFSEAGRSADAVIRDLLECWVVWRDAGDWERFPSVWHEDGWMNATWFQGSAADFVAASRTGFERGVHVLHYLGASMIDVSGPRAIAQTKMSLLQRAPVHGVQCDVTCFGRFYDFLERRDGRWGMVYRQPIFEKDRLDSVEQGARVPLDAEKLALFPEGYRHLAYLQEAIGLKVKRDLPGLRGPEVQALYARGRAWLAGEALRG